MMSSFLYTMIRVCVPRPLLIYFSMAASKDMEVNMNNNFKCKKYFTAITMRSLGLGRHKNSFRNRKNIEKI